MYHRVIPSRILTAVGIGLLIFSLVFGWVAFAVPDWLQFHEGDGQRPNDTTVGSETQDFKKFGLWYKCIFSVAANDFICKLWDKDTPSFVRVAQVLIPIGLALGCLSLVIACVGLICRRVFVTSLLFAALFAFLNFIFITIGITVFANESLVYVDRLRLPNNESPRRWGMWLLVPSLVLSFITSICFIVGSIMNWCDYRSMQVTGIFSHSGDKFNGSVCKAPSDSNATSGMKQPFQYQDYPNACYQINGMNHPQQNMMGYPPPPTYPGTINPAFQATPSTLFGYSRPGSPTMYPNTNLDPFHTRQYMTEMSEMDDLPHRGRSRHRSHSQSHSRSRRRSGHRSRSYSSCESASPNGRNPQATQFVPIPVPYYQAQPQPSMASQPTAVQQTPMTAPTTSAQSMPYVLPQATQQYFEDNSQTALKPTNIIKYNVAQPPVLVQNPNQPVYTIAYRANTGNNMLGTNVLTGPATTTYVTAAHNPVADLSSFNSDTDNEERPYQTIAKRKNLKKININETWAWRKMR